VDGQVRASSIVMYAVGLVVLAAATTAAFLAMRDLMAVGGSCASGGPYEVAVPCPEGTAPLIMGGIVGWIVGAGIVLIAGSDVPGDYGNVALLAWPGLFLSFAWNFLEYGLDPPSGGGANAGMVFCGVLFLLMGGVPLIFGIKAAGRALWPSAVTEASGSPAPGPSAPPSGMVHTSGTTVVVSPPVVPPSVVSSVVSAPVAAAAAGADRQDIVGELERLAGLRASGALDDDEYERAKDVLLGSTGEDVR
jgi:hypothetical protein